ncbi:MAG TPA: MarR family transcriptional regulator [Woeseiaceae bacterium]|nr:MarR family transcriptional regulator [Woeseiaceae bacterium]
MNTNRIAPHTEATVLQLLESAALLERRLDRSLSGARGISFSEYRLLSALADAGPGGCARIDLAGRVGLTASAVTRALRPLEKLGVVATERNERDARQSLAVITAAGTALLADARGVLRDALGSLALNDLPARKVAEFQDRLAELRSR